MQKEFWCPSTEQAPWPQTYASSTFQRSLPRWVQYWWGLAGTIHCPQSYFNVLSLLKITVIQQYITILSHHRRVFPPQATLRCLQQRGLKTPTSAQTLILLSPVWLPWNICVLQQHTNWFLFISRHWLQVTFLFPIYVCFYQNNICHTLLYASLDLWWKSILR